MRHILISMLVFVVTTEHLTNGQELLFKNFVRSNRGNRGPDEFEKFFLKASKSVPRIGRREFDMDTNINHKFQEDLLKEYYKNVVPLKVQPLSVRIDKKYDPTLNDVSWYDLADKIEYYPEILVSPSFLTNSGFKDMDSNTENKRMDSPGIEKNKEITEYRLQPES